MLSRHFLVALACYGGDRRRGRGQAATLAPGASVTAPALGPVMPHLPALGDGPTGRVWPVSPVQVSDTRSKPLNQEDSINGYQQLKTRSGTQDRNRQSDRSGKRGRRDHPSQRHLFADLPRGGQWKTTQSFRFVNLLSVAKLADQAHTLIAERKAEAAPAAGDNKAS